MRKAASVSTAHSARAKRSVAAAGVLR